MILVALTRDIISKTQHTTGNVVRAKGEIGSLEVWDSLLGDLYQSVLNPGGLSATLKSIDSWIGSSFTHFLIWDDKNNRERSSIVTHDSFEDATRKYNQYYGAIDPRRQLTLSQLPGAVWACHDHFDDRFVGRSEFYQDLLIPIGARYILMCYILRQDGVSGYLAFNHLAGQGHFSSQQKRAAAMLIPHLQRTIKLTMQSERFRGASFAGAASLNALDQAVFALDETGVVTFLNEKADTLLKMRRWLRTRDGRLDTLSVIEEDKFATALRRVRLSRQAETLALYGNENLSGDPDQTQVVTVIPMPIDGAVRPSPDISLVESHVSDLRERVASDLSHFTGAELIVLVSPQRRRSVISATSLRVLFKLTPAEARLAHDLAKGASVEDYAETAAISVATARTQLRSVLAKTGEKRLQDLVRMLASLPSHG